MFSKAFPFWIVKTRDCLVLKLTREGSISSLAKKATSLICRYGVYGQRLVFNRIERSRKYKKKKENGIAHHWVSKTVTSRCRVESECERKRTWVSIKQTLFKYRRICVVLRERCMEMTCKRTENKQEKMNEIHNSMYYFHVIMHSLSR